MKKVRDFLMIVVAILPALAGKAQLTGTKNVPGDYATLAAAITDLNTQGVGSGGVTLNLLAGNPETAPLGGYSITATGTVANTITIMGNANTITAPTPQTAGALNDAIFKVIGGDYIIIQGFTMQENAANTTTTAASNNMTEWGVAVLYASATDGAKNVTIQNNNISLNRMYQNSFGVYSSNLHTATNVITTADITDALGANDNLKIYTNSISNVNNGICIVGSSTGAFMATGVDIGGSGAGTGNTLTNYGTTGTFSAYVSVPTGAVNGISTTNILNVNISYNSITSSVGGTTSGTLRGILVQATGTLPTSGTIVNSINNNSISVKSGAVGGVINGIANTLGNLITTYTINNNDFNNSGHFNTSNSPLAGAAGAINVITSSAPAINVSINNNTFTSLLVNTSSLVRLISKSATHPSNAVININNNRVVNFFTGTGSGGSEVNGYISGSTSPSSVTETNSNNDFSNMTVTGSTSMRVWVSQDGSTKTVTGNTFSNITGGNFDITALLVGGNNGSVFNNMINTVSSNRQIIGVNIAISNANFFNNTINGLITTGASTISGVTSNAAAGATQNIYKNKIYDLTANNVSGTVNGILIASIVTTSNVYNNLIGDLKTPQTSNVDAIRGISSINVPANTALNISYNTIYINASSSGTNFGTSGIYHTYDPGPANATLNLKNNIIVNTSTPNGTGLTVAFRRSAGTDLNNFGAVSNNNLFYAGTPGANRSIFYDGTNADQTLAAYKVRVAPRDANSVTELPPFLSTLGSSANFLHIDPSAVTQIEGGGIVVAGITDDFDGNTRNVSIPDIGADEFTGPARAAIKIFLQGAYSAGLSRHKDVNAIWASVLNANALSQPYNTAVFGNYAGTESVASGFFTSTTDTTNILDWVLLELRDATTPTTVIARRAAFVREDGRVVDLNGISDVNFPGVSNGNYYVVIRHRNHLGIRSATAITLNSGAATPYDFTTAQTQAFQDGAITTNAAMKDLGGGVFGLWAGNANSNTTVKYAGGSNDVSVLLAALSGNQATILTNVYGFADLNLDGTIKYAGGSNDVSVLLAALGGDQSAIFTQHQ